MRITLEKEDLLSILSKSLGYTLYDEDVTVQADPFEVHIRSVNVGEMAEQISKATAAPADPVTNQPATPSQQDTSNSVLTVEDVMDQNEEMLTHPLGPGETEEPPPITDVELYGRKSYGR